MFRWCGTGRGVVDEVAQCVLLTGRGLRVRGAAVRGDSDSASTVHGRRCPERPDRTGPPPHIYWKRVELGQLFGRRPLEVSGRVIEMVLGDMERSLRQIPVAFRQPTPQFVQWRIEHAQHDLGAQSLCLGPVDRVPPGPTPPSRAPRCRPSQGHVRRHSTAPAQPDHAWHQARHRRGSDEAHAATRQPSAEGPTIPAPNASPTSSCRSRATHRSERESTRPQP